MTRFTKGPKRFDEQRELAQSRGLLGDPARLEKLLSTSNYYRLSAYWYTFRALDRATNQRGEQLADGCTLDLVWERYCFDRKLRLLVMDAIERIEVALRTQLAYHHAHEHGPFGYVDDPTALPKLLGSRNAAPQVVAKAQRDRADLIQRITDETERARGEVFVRTFFEKHGDSHRHLPIWMATEIFSFRTLLTVYQSCSKKVKNAVAATFGAQADVFASWLVSLNTVRNVCAHHGRLWNREIGARPIIPTGSPYRDWNTPVLIKHERMFAPLTVINYLVDQVAPEDCWGTRFRALLDRHPCAPAKYMGFPDRWLESPLWASARASAQPTPPVSLPFEDPFPK